MGVMRHQVKQLFCYLALCLAIHAYVDLVISCLFCLFGFLVE